MRGLRTLQSCHSRLSDLTFQDVRVAVERADVLFVCYGNSEYAHVITQTPLRDPDLPREEVFRRCRFTMGREVLCDVKGFDFTEREIDRIDAQVEVARETIRRHYVKLASAIAPAEALQMIEGATPEDILDRALDGALERMLAPIRKLSFPAHFNDCTMRWTIPPTMASLTIDKFADSINIHKPETNPLRYALAIEFGRAIRFVAAMKIQLEAMARAVPADWTP